MNMVNKFLDKQIKLEEMTREQLLGIINSNKVYRERAIDAICQDKVFIVVYGKRIVSFFRTIFGAEYCVKKDKDYYYDFDIKERVQVDSPLQIVEISAFDIIGYE